MMRLSAIASMVGCSDLRAACAAWASPEAIAFWTFLIALRSVVRRLMFAARCFTDFLARFAACLELAMTLSFLRKSECGGAGVPGEACYDTPLVHIKQRPGRSA